MQRSREKPVSVSLEASMNRSGAVIYHTQMHHYTSLKHDGSNYDPMKLHGRYEESGWHSLTPNIRSLEKLDSNSTLT